MEDLAANLDDGESWLPSDIFPTEESHHQHNHNRSTAVTVTSIEDLNRHFNNLSFLHHHHSLITHKPPISQRLEMYGAMTQLQYAVTTPTPNGCYGLSVGPKSVDHGLFNYDSGPVHSIPDIPVRHFSMHKPVAEQLMETRIARNSRPVHRQQQNRLYTLQPSGCESGFGLGFGLMRNCRGGSSSSSSSTSSGTGVFIPCTTSHSAIRSDGETYKPSGVAPHRGTTRRLGTRKAEENYCCKSVGSSEVGLPKDWTY
ncbi:hypothetical protein BVRB_7g158170 [Beta vulgaris subsp. vulgaris]|uniref:uncharacterized protein LOC104898251 n=1 Tax=Beta vulgaris subsp. vulgaris TaxID=3555 RepID=UPI0005402622|nr:uncharacterized protein LOC104898251 [Beta vulgaris subsp. vulgaris]KMT06652.1 hypothetical protein BVRB_7g158170 [Beta vulgaris subsp. vulgaris]